MFEEYGFIEISMEQFCNKAKIRPDNWIFDDIDPSKAKFYYSKAVHNIIVDEPERYYFNDGKVIREFKHMRKYGETWQRVYDMTVVNSSWSLWSTWSVW